MSRIDQIRDTLEKDYTKYPEEYAVLSEQYGVDIQELHVQAMIVEDNLVFWEKRCPTDRFEDGTMLIDAVLLVRLLDGIKLPGWNLGNICFEITGSGKEKIRVPAELVNEAIWYRVVELWPPLQELERFWSGPTAEELYDLLCPPPRDNPLAVAIAHACDAIKKEKTLYQEGDVVDFSREHDDHLMSIPIAEPKWDAGTR